MSALQRCALGVCSQGYRVSSSDDFVGVVDFAEGFQHAAGVDEDSAFLVDVVDEVSYQRLDVPRLRALRLRALSPALSQGEREYFCHERWRLWRAWILSIRSGWASGVKD